jgi:ubiquinone/menaquinone biosynthesis C-methylase UbiE
MSQGNRENDTERAPLGDAPRGLVQGDVNRHFDSTAAYWDGVYRGEDLQGRIYQARQRAVLGYVQAAGLDADAEVLEIGCGAGHLTTGLAELAPRVQAVDASEGMVYSAAGRVREAGLQERVQLRVADVHALPFESERFSLVVAVGVIPWLHSPGGGVAEMARVLRPGGELIVTADNRARLISFTDPRAILALTPLKRVYDKRQKDRGVATSRLDFPRRIDEMLSGAGLRPVARRTIGFGPLSFLGRPIFSDRRGVRINSRLQALADRGVPGVRWTGWHYVVRAIKEP